MSRTAIFFVQVESKGQGRYFVERDAGRMDLQSTIEDIATGQIEDMVAVIECDPENFWSEDVTTQIAAKVAQVWSHRGEALTERQYNFVEQHISINTARYFRRAA